MPLASFPCRLHVDIHVYSGIVALVKFVPKPFLLLCQLALMFEGSWHQHAMSNVAKSFRPWEERPGNKALYSVHVHVYTGSSMHPQESCSLCVYDEIEYNWCRKYACTIYTQYVLLWCLPYSGKLWRALNLANRSLECIGKFLIWRHDK